MSQQPKTWEEALRMCMRETLAIMRERHQKYGPDNFARYGGFGVLVRLSDKTARLEGIYKRGQSDFTDESEDDTWADISNYGLIGMMLRRGWWNLPAAVLGEVDPPTHARSGVPSSAEIMGIVASMRIHPALSADLDRLTDALNRYAGAWDAYAGAPVDETLGMEEQR